MRFHELGSFTVFEQSERRLPPLRSVLALGISTSMAEQAIIETEITFIPKSEGGRDIPDGILQGLRYRPHIVIGDPMQRQAIIEDGNRLVETYLGIAFADGPQHIEPGSLSVRRWR